MTTSGGGRAPRPGLPTPVVPEALGAAGGRPPVWSVSDLSRELHRRLDGLGRIAVRGEVVESKLAGSGHLYFRLKDLDAVLSCAIWRSRVRGALDFELADGMLVVAHGRLEVYRQRGTYSLIVERLEAHGVGDLMARFEQAKRLLQERGWFDRARALPPWPRVVGLATSRDGAALQDILRTRSMRWPLYPLRLAHCRVQGPGAAEEIADAVRRLDASGVDLIVVARGGGSMEDLWAFNEPAVTEAIWRASVPVVSAVGHETDFTLADFVADLRAHTPTDAAQVVIPDRAACVGALERAAAHLAAGIDRALERRGERLRSVSRARVLRGADWMLGDRERRIVELGRRQARVAGAAMRERGLRLASLAGRLAALRPTALLERAQARCARLVPRLQASSLARLARLESRLEVAAGRLGATSPEAVLERGYSITRRADGSLLRASDGVVPGERIETQLARGLLRSRVEEVQPRLDAAE